MSLKWELEDPRYPIGAWFRERLPNTRAVYGAVPPDAELLVARPAGLNPGTLGTMFGLWVAARAGGTRELGLWRRSPDVDDVLGAALDEVLLGELSSGWAADASARVWGRHLWVAALVMESVRVGRIWPGSALDVLEDRSPAGVLGLAPVAAVEDLVALAGLAEVELVPRVVERAAPVLCDQPLFASRYLPADADLISGGLLVEIKATQGELRKAGRRWRLSSQWVWQVSGYALMDSWDEFGIDTVAFYSARYGIYVEWPLQEWFDLLCGGRADVPALRAELEVLLRELAVVPA